MYKLVTYVYVDADTIPDSNVYEFMDYEFVILHFVSTYPRFLKLVSADIICLGILFSAY